MTEEHIEETLAKEIGMLKMTCGVVKYYWQATFLEEVKAKKKEKLQLCLTGWTAHFTG